MAQRPVVLAILDGWGLSERREDNAPALAHTPHFDRLWQTAPRATLRACGEDVGLPAGQIGNSEVGHTNIGAGRVVWMDLPRIDRAIAECRFASNAALEAFAARLRETGGRAHLIGLASPGGVHAHQRHIAAAARVLAEKGVPVRLHLFTDGRDVPPRSAKGQVSALLAELAALPDTRVATVTGRFYGMDRDSRWDRVARAWSVIQEGAGERAADPIAAIDAAYARGESDEFVSPTVIGAHEGGIAPEDGLFCLNFRADRAREILGAFLDPDFPGTRGAFQPPAAALGLVSYSDRLDRLMPAMFPPEPIVNTLGAWVSQHGLRQFRVAETEKYPHVTFFLNGGVETPYAGERRHMAPSPKVRTYDEAPEMAAAEVTAKLVGAIRDRYDLIVANFANPDMVGHTGDLQAAIRACEAVDAGLGLAVAAVEEVGGAMLVTADHGNCEVMADAATGGPHTAHTLNEVPLILVGGAPGCGLADGRLADLAPTALALMGLPQPPEMTGRSLLSGAAG